MGGIIVEWLGSGDRMNVRVRLQGERRTVSIDFVRQARYSGRRAREISDIGAANKVLRSGGYAIYKDSIDPTIPEGGNVGIDWADVIKRAFTTAPKEQHAAMIAAVPTTSGKEQNVSAEPKKRGRPRKVKDVDIGTDTGESSE